VMRKRESKKAQPSRRGLQVGRQPALNYCYGVQPPEYAQFSSVIQKLYFPWLPEDP
jgi:hypothetical protein